MESGPIAATRGSWHGHQIQMLPAALGGTLKTARSASVSLRATSRTIVSVREKDPFLSQFCIQKRSFYQDRLGTNVGKVLKTRGDLISPGTSRGPLSPESASMTMQSCATASKPGKKTAL